MLQIVEQTKEEKMAMYMKLPKKQIAEMLINCNDIITALMQGHVSRLLGDAGNATIIMTKLSNESQSNNANVLLCDDLRELINGSFGIAMNANPAAPA